MKLLSFLLSAFLTVVLAVGVLPRDPGARMGLLQLWLLSPVALAGGIGLAYLFASSVARFSLVMRLTAPGVAIVAAIRGAWAWMPPLLLLGAVFHVVYWFAGRLEAGRGFAGAIRDARYLLEDLRARATGREPPVRDKETGSADQRSDDDGWPDS